MGKPLIASTSIGRAVAGVSDAHIKRRVHKAGRTPVLSIHGAGAGTTTGAYTINDGGAANKDLRSLLRYIVKELDVAVFQITAQNVWGNAVSTARINSLLDYALAEHGCELPAVVVGASMGGLGGLNFIKAFPEKVAGMVGVIPVVDVDDIRDNNLWGVRADIDAAHGVVYPAPLPAGFNPADDTAAYVDVPMQMWYASNDDIARAAPLEAFGAATGAEIHNLGALGHTVATIAAIDDNAVVEFISSLIE